MELHWSHFNNNLLFVTFRFRHFAEACTFRCPEWSEIVTERAEESTESILPLVGMHLIRPHKQRRINWTHQTREGSYRASSRIIPPLVQLHPPSLPASPFANETSIHWRQLIDTDLGITSRDRTKRISISRRSDTVQRVTLQFHITRRKLDDFRSWNTVFAGLMTPARMQWDCLLCKQQKLFLHVGVDSVCQR